MSYMKYAAVLCAAAFPVVSNAQFGGPFSTGTIPADLAELSGLVASRSRPGIFWANNDSGDGPNLYAIDSTGKVVKKVTVKGADAVDWEDITIRPSSKSSYELIVGDIGDNAAKRSFITLYYIDEPSAQGSSCTVKRRQNLVYPDGPRDAETVIADPVSGNVYIISKREYRNIIYKVPIPSSKNAKNVDTLIKVGILPFGQTVSGDISPDGKSILLKTYVHVYSWKRNDVSKSIEEVLDSPFTIENYIPEPQGESIAFTHDAKAYRTASEAENGAPSTTFYIYPKVNGYDEIGKLRDTTAPSIEIIKTDTAKVFLIRYSIRGQQEIQLTLHNAFMFKLADIEEASVGTGVRQHDLDVRTAPAGEYVVVLRSNQFYTAVPFRID